MAGVVVGWWVVVVVVVVGAAVPGVGGCRLARATMRWLLAMAWRREKKESLPPEMSAMVSMVVWWWAETGEKVEFSVTVQQDLRCLVGQCNRLFGNFWKYMILLTSQTKQHTQKNTGR